MSVDAGTRGGNTTGMGFQRLSPADALNTLQRAAEASINGIVISDARLPDMPIVYVNPAFEQMTGYMTAEVLGRNCRFLQGPDTKREEVARLRQALESGEPCSVKLRNYRKDGGLFWNRLDVSPIRDDSGAVTHFIGVQLDITREIEAEEARQAEQARKLAILDAVGDIAHDITNMMAPVEGWASLLDDLLPEAKAALQRISSTAAAEDVAAIRELLDLMPDALDGIRGGADDAKDRGAEIADALKGNLRAPRFAVRDVAETAYRVARTLRPRAEADATRLRVEGHAGRSLSIGSTCSTPYTTSSTTRLPMREAALCGCALPSPTEAPSSRSQTREWACPSTC